MAELIKKLNPRNKKYTKKQIIIMSVIVLVVVAVIGITYSFYAQRKTGWKQKYSVSGLTFTLNGRNSKSDAVVYNCTVARGEERNIPLKLATNGSAMGTYGVDYTIKFALDGNDKDAAKVVEVYSLENGKYVYKGMLDKLVSDDEKITGTMGIKDTVSYNYRLVYSQGAGESYEGKSFSLKITADYQINSDTDNYYVVTAADLEKVTTADVGGKTISLLGDITLDKAISLDSKTGLNLNGHTLNLNGHNITIKYSGTGLSKLGLDGDSDKLIGGGKIIVDCADDVYRVDDSFKDCSMLEVKAFSVSSLASALQKELTELGKSKYYNNDVIDFINGYRCYLNSSVATSGAMTIAKATGCGNVDVQTDGSYKIAAQTETFTDTYAFDVTANGNSEKISEDFNVIGTSVDSIANNLINAVPTTINSSVFLTTYDSKTKTNVTWVTSNSDYVTDEGIFLAHGKDKLTTWTNHKIKLGVICEKNGKTTYKSKTVTIVVLTPAERTELLFTYANMSISEVNGTVDISTDTYMNLSDYQTKTGLSSYGIAVDATGTVKNVNYNGTDWYLTNTTADNNKVVKMAVKPTSASAVVVPATLTFTYSDYATEPYTISRNITAVGHTGDYTYVDYTNEIQADFINPDLNKSAAGYKFWVNGTLPTGRLIDFEVGSSYTDSVKVTNGIFVPDSENGIFYYDTTDSMFHEATKTTSSELQRYSRKCLVEVLPAYVPYTGETAAITAKSIESAVDDADVFTYSADTINKYGTGCYTTAENAANLVYEKQKGTDKNVEYPLTLAIDGIYHYNDYTTNGQSYTAEIPDYAMYKKLCTYFDTDKDGWISATEAKQTVTGKTNSEYSLSYVDLSNAEIKDITGLNYFTACTGFDLSGNSIVNLETLSKISKLKYLDLSDNLVADITSLQYLDDLKYLDLSNSTNSKKNDITDVTPIKYLKNIEYLNLRYNNNLKDISALENYTKLKYINVFVDTSVNNLLSSSTSNNAYVLALIYAHSQAKIYNSSDTVVNPAISTTDAGNAALAVSKLVKLYETNNTLYFPENYVYNGETYNFTYITSSSNLVFKEPVSSGSYPITTGYTITSPDVDTPVNIDVFVHSGTNTDVFSFCRSFTITLRQLKDENSQTYIQKTDGTVLAASLVVPDTSLRAKLFESFNDDKTGTVTIDEKEYTQSKIITQAEINAAGKELNYKDYGIKSLEGISNFSGTTSGKGITLLNLVGNPIESVKNVNGTYPDISELSKLSNMTELSLGGQKYDFSMLSTYVQNDSTSTSGYYNVLAPTVTGLTGLTKLDVSGCYDLDDEEVQQSLYQVYLANVGCSVYKDSASVAWNPYLIPLSEYSNSIPDEFVFENLGDEANLFEDNNGLLRSNVVNIKEKSTDELKSYFYKFRFYNTMNIYFSFKKSTTSIKGNRMSNATTNSKYCISGKLSTNYTVSTSNNVSGYVYAQGLGFDYSGINRGASSNSLYSRDASAMVTTTLTGLENDNAGTVGRTTAITADHTLHIKLEMNKQIKLKFGDMTEYKTLDEIFPGKTLRQAVSDYLCKTSNLKVNGTTVSNLYSYAMSAGNPNHELDFTSSGNITDSSNNKITSIAVTSKLVIDGSYEADKGSAITGLKYTGCTSLYIYHDADIGDGSELVNLEGLYFTLSSVDFSKVTTSLPKLTTLYLGSFDVTGATKTNTCNASVIMYDTSYAETLKPYLDKLALAADGEYTMTERDWNRIRTIVRSKDENGKFNFYMNYMPSLTSIIIQNSNVTDWRFTASMLFSSDTNNGSHDANSVETLYFYNFSTNSTYNPNKYFNGKYCEPIVQQIYNKSTASNKDYKIGAKADDVKTTTSSVAYTPDSFRKYVESHDSWLAADTTNSYKNVITETNEIKKLKSYYTDLGIKIGSSYYSSMSSATANSAGDITLPAKTGDYIFGANLSDTAQTDINSVRNYGITWSVLNTDVTMSTNSDGVVLLSYTGSASAANDNYVVFKAVITFTSSSTSTLYFPVLIKGTGTVTDNVNPNGSYSFGKFSDSSLRFAMFLNNGKVSTITTAKAAAVTSITYSSIPSYSTYKNYVNGVLSLDGMEIFTNLATLDMSGQFISDVSALSGLTSLTSLNLSNNLVSSVNFSSLTNLTNLDLSGNALKTIKSGSSCTLPVSLTSLNLVGNSLISAEDIATMTNMNSLTTLNIKDTRAADDSATLTAISAMLAAQDRTLAFTAHSGDASSITSQIVSDYINYINGTQCDTYFKTLYDGNATYTNLGLSNMTKYVSFVNSCVYSSSAAAQIASVLGKYSTGVRITDNTYSQLSVVENVAIQFTQTDMMPIYCSADNVLINYSDLDPALYAYLIYYYQSKNDTIGTYNGQSCFIISSSITDIKISSEFAGIGIKSLKGLEKLPNLKTVSVYGANLTELGFTSNLTNLTSLTLDNCVLTSSAFANGIDKCVSLTTLNTLTSFGIDYQTNSIASTLGSISSLKTLSVNNAYNYLGVYDSDILKNDVAYVNNSNLLFGSGRAISGYNNGGLGIMTAEYIDSTGAAAVKYYNGRNNLVAYHLHNKMYTDVDNFSFQYLTTDITRMNKWNNLVSTPNSSVSQLRFINRNIMGYLNSTAQRLLAATGNSNNMYLYYDDFANSTTGVDFYLPSNFNIMGQKATVTWTVSSANTSITSNAGDLLNQTETGGQYTFAINSNIANVASLKNGNKITLTSTITYNGKSSTDTFTINIVRNVDSSTWSDEDVTSTVNTAGDYYIEDENGRIVPANTYFRSAKLVDYIFNSAIGTSANMSTAGGVKISLSTETSNMIDYVAGRKYLSYKSILSVSKFNIATTNSGLITVTNLDGIQIFRNLKDLSVGIGYINSIEPLSQLQLTSFSYANGDSNTLLDTAINDWTPLYNSRNTLTTFSYGTNKYIQYDNLSFLMQYPSLTSVTIGTASASVGIDKIHGFRYMLEWMAKYRSNLKLTFNGTDILNSGAVVESENLSTDFKAAENVLEKFTATAESGITYSNNFEIGLKSGKSKGEEIVLPSYIDVGGKKYPIEWQSGSSDITVSTPTLADGSTEDDYFVDGLSWKMKISTSSEGMANLVARIKIGNYIYERVFGVNCNQDNVYPSVHVSDGFGRVVLVGAWTSADSAYTLSAKTVDSNTYTILTFNNAVSGTVYVNNPDGDKVPIYCNWSSDDASKVTSFMTEIAKWTSGTYSVSDIVNNDVNAKKVLSLYSNMTASEKNYYFAKTTQAKAEHDMLENIRAALKSEAFVEDEVSKYYDRMVSAFGTVSGL